MRRNPKIVLAAVLLSTVSLPITLTGASVALSDIAADLNADLTPVQWVVTGYNAAFGSFMLAGGSLADILGRRRMYALGLALFVVTGLISAVTNDIMVLDVVRAIAGIGAAAAAASGAALLAASFEGAARTRAFGLFGTAIGVGLAFGPTIAGVLVDAFGWRAAFAAPALVALAVLAMVPRLPESRDPAGRRVDVPETLSFTLFLLALIFAVVEGPRQGWTSLWIVGAFVASAALLVCFVVVERCQENPMFDFGLLRSRHFVAFSAAAATIICVMIPLLIYLPSYFTGVLGMTSGQAGATLILLTSPALALPLVGSFITRWIPPTAVVVTAVILVGVGAAWLTIIEPGISTIALAGPLLCIGVGMGVTTGMIDGVALASIDTRRAGTAAGMLNTARIAGETIVIAIFGAVLASTTGGRLADPGYTRGLHLTLWGMSGLAAVTVLLVALLLRRRASAPRPRPTVGPAYAAVPPTPPIS
ncbi:MFS transporter [Micromonospora sp. NBC_01412]|uniref:MFS transporter n=1 Tax=Micromonospora sp. NBC_01412 TaxID=2903590 RepID=UPI0032467F0A